ncbi:MAG: hypothetical protein ACREM3_23740 [Candidatus Rokuibacteriota bacterium]
MAGAAPAAVLAALLALGAPAAAGAQAFLAATPDPPFEVGPLFVRARVTPELGDTRVDVVFSLVTPPATDVAAVAQDLTLLWPGAVVGDPALGKPEPAFGRAVEPQGFTVIDEGRVPIVARNLYARGPDGRLLRESIPGGGQFVTFVREGGALGLTPPATLIRIPWSPRLVDREWMVDVRLTTRAVVKPKPATWFERTFWGERHRLTLSFGDVRQRVLFPLYFKNRDRVIKLSDEPSQIVVTFADADRLKIDELFPASIRRQRHETLDNTEQVSLFLDPREGLRPQTLAVEFGYFSSLQSWAPVLVPTLFFVLGNIAAVLVRNAAEKTTRRLSGRFQVGRAAPAPPARDSGTIVSRETLARVVPGETRYDDVRRLISGHPEEQERLESPGRKTLVYRGRRVVPHRRRSFGWLFATVDHWDVEEHEVDIEMDHDVVSDVHARVRRGRAATPAAPA